MDEQTSVTSPTNYTVVARRYRPRSFDELIGQDHIAHALHTAIMTGRVGHAYLFTGARGVGKTSSARIFAKALNTSGDLDSELAADIAQAIETGDDMDVIEIDGASNRGIEEIRQLRANVNVRPSRARYKIYIIDEVHMLTNQAFNALLKTLEEPPPHVKFIFCTTDPDKLPITVLSRCQRFDFVPIKLADIQARLKEICAAEGFQATDQALALLARRAAGSMRDSQSLLEQVMSFAAETIDVDQVQQLLGIADEGRLLALAEALAANDALQAIELAEEAARGGADAGQLAEQLLNYLRDLMTVAIGGGPDLLKLANPAGIAGLQALAQRWGVQSLLSAITILDEALVRMRSSVSAQALLEVALVQICHLAHLASIPALIEALRGGAAAAPAVPTANDTATAQKKNDSSAVAIAAQSPTAAAQIPAHAMSQTSPTRVHAVDEVTPAMEASSNTEATAVRESPGNTFAAEPSPTPVANSQATDNAGRQTENYSRPSGDYSGTALEQWQAAVGTIDGILADYAGLASAVEPSGGDQWVIVFPPGKQRARDYCDQPERKSELAQVLRSTVGRAIRLSFSVQPGEPPQALAAINPSAGRVQKMREVSENPFVKKVCEALDGEILRVDPPSQIPAPKVSVTERRASQS